MITSNSTEILNRADFEQFFEEVCVGEAEILEELASDIKREGQELVDSILSSFKSEDLVVLQRSAHTLKSSTRIFGGVLISQQAADIEKLANPDSPADFGTVSGALADIQENFSNFLIQLETVIDSKK
ncbi:MAG: Hpt domain-containing protein [Verrucomicrobiae bacterium]|nr:Hpt domain-containing protein [Verrucomicrobiae bacterium]